MRIDCKKAAELIDQQDAAENIGWWGRRKLRFHLVLCRMCKGYNGDSKVITKIIHLAGVKYSDSCLSDHEKEEIKRNLNGSGQH